MGSFYLVNLILAIVAMSYDDCQKKDQEEADEAEEAEEENAVFFIFYQPRFCVNVRLSVSVYVECKQKPLTRRHLSVSKSSVSSRLWCFS